MRRFRKKHKVTREEVIADIIFFLVPAVISFAATFFFSVHRSFYDLENFQLQFIFTTPEVYLAGTLVGGVIGFFLIKLFLLGLKEEEIAEGARRRK